MAERFTDAKFGGIMPKDVLRWCIWDKYAGFIWCTLSDSKQGSRQLLKTHLYPKEDVTWEEMKTDDMKECLVRISVEREE